MSSSKQPPLHPASKQTQFNCLEAADWHNFTIISLSFPHSALTCLSCDRTEAFFRDHWHSDGLGVPGHLIYCLLFFSTAFTSPVSFTSCLFSELEPSLHFSNADRRGKLLPFYLLKLRGLLFGKVLLEQKFQFLNEN